MRIRSSSNIKQQVTNLQYQYYAAFTATLCIMTSGMHYGWPSPSIPKLLDGSQLEVTNEESSWIAVMPLIASVFGAALSSTMLDTIGRKNSILISGLPFIISWLMIAFSANVATMYAARFLAGLSDGIAFTAVPMYIGEIADPSIRGFLGSSCSISFISGVLIINGLGLYLSIFTTALMATLWPIAFMISFWFMPESPYYLILKNRNEEAKNSLMILKGVKDVDGELNRLTQSIKEDVVDGGKFFDLFTVASNRKAVLITIGIRTVQQLSGITAITFYTKTIFQETGQYLSSEVTTVAYYVVELIMTCLSSLILDKAGRRPLMLISTVGTAITLMAEGTYFYLATNTTLDLESFNYVPIIALIAFIICYSIGMGTIPILMLGELFPTNVKAFAICLADIYFSIIATVVSKFFQLMKDNFGMSTPFFCFTICCFVGIFFVAVCLPETKGKTLQEIQDNLKGIQHVDVNDKKEAA